MAIKTSGGPGAEFSNPRWVYRTAPDGPVPLVVVVNHGTRRSIAGGFLAFGSKIGNAAAMAAYFGNGSAFVDSPHGIGSDLTVVPTWPTVAGSLKGINSVNLVSAIANDGDGCYTGNPATGMAFPPGGAAKTGGLVAYSENGGIFDWCSGHLYGKRAVNSGAGHGPMPATPRDSFIAWSDQQAGYVGGIANVDFLVVEARIHEYNPETVTSDFGFVTFYEGTVVYDANGSSGRTNALAYVDANY